MIDPNPIPATSTSFMLPGVYTEGKIYAIGHPDIMEEDGQMIMELVEQTPMGIIRGIRGTDALSWPAGAWVESYETPQA